jgi:Cu-Zn family superoxide dismutase
LKTTAIIVAALAAAILTAVGSATPRPAEYVLEGNAVFPEGVAFDQRTGAFYVGSTTDGTVFRGDLKEPQTEIFLAGGSDGRGSAIGMKVDDLGRLYVAGGGTRRVDVYDTATGGLVRTFTTRAEGASFLNDVAIAKNGDAFVTDSMAPILYRIPADAVVAGAPTAAEEWLDFTGTEWVQTPGFNANGIAATPDGRYLIVAQSSTGKLFRIELATKDVREIALDEPVSADGIALRGRMLYAVARPDIAEIGLSGDLLSGTVSRTFDPSLDFPTTLAIARGRLLVVNSQFDKRSAGLPPELPFTVSSIPIP